MGFGTKSALLLLVLLVLLSFSVGAADCGGIAACNCGDRIVNSRTLDATDGLTTSVCTNDGLTVDSGVVLNCNGRYINGSGAGGGNKRGLLFNGSRSFAANCTIQNFKEAVQFDSSSDNSSIDNISVYDVVDSGFRLNGMGSDHVGNISITNSNIWNTSSGGHDGIMINFSSEPTINNVNISLIQTAIRIDNETKTDVPILISSLTINSTTTGVLLDDNVFSQKVIIKNVYINNTPTGMQLQGNGLFNISNNVFSNSTTACLSVLFNHSFIFNNTFKSCNQGVQCNAPIGCINNTIHENIFTSNTVGANVSNSNAANNTFYNNTFYSSTLVHADAGSQNLAFWNNSATGNYWGDLFSSNKSLVDSNLDGYGDAGSAFPYNSTNFNVSRKVEDFMPIFQPRCGESAFKSFKLLAQIKQQDPESTTPFICSSGTNNYVVRIQDWLTADFGKIWHNSSVPQEPILLNNSNINITNASFRVFPGGIITPVTSRIANISISNSEFFNLTRHGLNLTNTSEVRVTNSNISSLLSGNVMNSIYLLNSTNVTMDNLIVVSSLYGVFLEFLNPAENQLVTINNSIINSTRAGIFMKNSKIYVDNVTFRANTVGFQYEPCSLCTTINFTFDRISENSTQFLNGTTPSAYMANISLEDSNILGDLFVKPINAVWTFLRTVFLDTRDIYLNGTVNATNLSFNNSVTEIMFYNISTTFSDKNFTGEIGYENRFARLNVSSTTLSELNSSALVTMRSFKFDNNNDYTILRDDGGCPSGNCSKVSSSPISFNVSQWGVNNFSITSYFQTRGNTTGTNDNFNVSANEGSPWFGRPINITTNATHGNGMNMTINITVVDPKGVTRVATVLMNKSFVDNTNSNFTFFNISNVPLNESGTWNISLNMSNENVTQRNDTTIQFEVIDNIAYRPRNFSIIENRSGYTGNFTVYVEQGSNPDNFTYSNFTWGFDNLNCFTSVNFSTSNFSIDNSTRKVVVVSFAANESNPSKVQCNNTINFSRNDMRGLSLARNYSINFTYYDPPGGIPELKTPANLVCNNELGDTDPCKHVETIPSGSDTSFTFNVVNVGAENLQTCAANFEGGHFKGDFVVLDRWRATVDGAETWNLAVGESKTLTITFLSPISGGRSDQLRIVCNSANGDGQPSENSPENRPWLDITVQAAQGGGGGGVILGGGGGGAEVTPELVAEVAAQVEASLPFISGDGKCDRDKGEGIGNSSDCGLKAENIICKPGDKDCIWNDKVVLTIGIIVLLAILLILLASRKKGKQRFVGD